MWMLLSGDAVFSYQLLLFVCMRVFASFALR